MLDGMVSVIIPVYNAEKFIEQTIKSVLSQSYKNFEIVLVDDCSTDASGNIIKSMQKEHSEIRYYKLDKNSGAAVARNKAIELAEGQFIAFLDSDDCWKPEKLEKQIQLANEKKAEFVFNAIEMIDENGNLVKGKRKIPSRVDYKFLLTNTVIPTSGVLIDISKTGKFQMPLIRSGQDYATWLMLLRDGRVAYGLNEALTQYRRTEGSLSSKKSKNWKKVWRIQVEFEKINPLIAYIHCFMYAINAVKKYYLGGKQ